MKFLNMAMEHGKVGTELFRICLKINGIVKILQYIIGGFPMKFKTEIRYLKIGGYHILI